MLWARSGNRCSLCRIELVQEIKEVTDKLIIGEECHIVSSKNSGPRGTTEFSGDFDSFENLILLCSNDHKRIDELTEIYTADKLKLIKENHESWVKTTLERDVIVFANDMQNIKSLPRILTGKQLIAIINGAHMFDFDHDELNTESEATLIGGMFEELKDYGDILSEIGYSEVAKLSVRYNNEIEELEQLGFLLFGIRRKLRLHNEKNEDMGIYDVATLLAVRTDNPSIVGNFLIVKFPTKISLG
jgi:hypothetical protein